MHPFASTPATSLLRTGITLLTALATAACASLPAPPRQPPLRLLVLPVPPSAEIPTLESISSVKPPDDRPDDGAHERALIAARLAEVQRDTGAAMADTLQATGHFAVCRDASVARLADALKADDPAETISPGLLDRFQQQDCAQALLRFRITDYGSVPKSWNKWIVAGTGAWIGTVTVLAYANPQTRPLIGAYLLSEGVQESASTYAGYTLIDRVYRPVRIEAEVVDLHTGQTRWQAGATGLARHDSILPVNPTGDDRIAAKLDVAADNAIRSLVQSLDARGLSLETGH